jgi:hypothetical protein
MAPRTRKCICGCDTTSPATMARHRRQWLESPKMKSSKFTLGMAKLSSQASQYSRPLRAPPARPVAFTRPSGTDKFNTGPEDPGPSSSGRNLRPREVLSNEDRLSDYSESSLSIASPVVSDNENDGPGQDFDESETESDESWEDELEGDPNRGQNLQFRLQAAAAGLSSLLLLRKI